MERPPEHERPFLIRRLAILRGVRRVGAGGRKLKLAEPRPPKRAGSDAVLSASLQADDGAISSHLRPTWRKGATSRPFLSRQPWSRGPSTLWPLSRSRRRICENALGR